MKKLLTLTFVLSLFLTTTYAQSLVQYKAGHTFNIGLPSYMSKTNGLNDDATIEFKNTVKDVYGFVIFDTKEDLKLAEISFTSANEFAEDFMKDFLKDEEKRTATAIKYKTVGDIHFAESEISYYDTELKAEIWYLVGAVETKNAYYKVICWTGAENKDKFRADFQSILYSVKD